MKSKITDILKIIKAKPAVPAAVTVLILTAVLCTAVGLHRSEPKKAETTVQSTTAPRSLLYDVHNCNVYITKYYVYGTHFHIDGELNLKDYPGFSRMGLVLRSADGSEKQLALKCKKSKDKIKFRTSDYINDGLCLDELQTGDYCLLFKVTDGEKPLYVSANTKVHFPEFNYYTVTRNGKNNLVRMGFTIYDTSTEEIPCLAMEIREKELPDDVYDIVIDAGHGGDDPGAVYKGKKESDYTLKYAKALKKSLEALGLKVRLTRDGSEKSDAMIPTAAFNKNGRVERACSSKAKYNFSIHFNSTGASKDDKPSEQRGFQIYGAYGINTDFASSIANNVKDIAKAKLSDQEFCRVSPGVYIRTYNKGDKKKADDLAKKLGYKKYGSINEKTTYYYMIRELGGIVTGAYVDGRSSEYSFNKNKYRKSVNGIESYLLEIGYICNESDMKNIQKNQSVYIKAITLAIAKELGIESK